MNKRWQVSTDQVTWDREVVPLNASKLKITESRDLDSGQIFFRKKLSTAIQFWGRSPGNDYGYFRTFERSESRRCQPIYIRLQLYCNGSWSTFWTGVFSTGAGKWDLDQCTFEVKPETVDRYTCILQHLKDQKNILDAPAYLTMVHSGPGLEFYACSYEFVDEVGPLCTNPTGTGWTYMDAYVIDMTPLYLAPTWVRKRAKTICQGGSPSPPDDSGWTLLSNDCATDGTATYVKGLTSEELGELIVDGSIFPDLQPGTCVGGVSYPPTEAYGQPFNEFSRIELFDCTHPIHPSMWLFISFRRVDTDIIGSGASRTGRRLRDVADLLLSDCFEAGSVVSDFFGINPAGDADGYVAGENYVTRLATTTEDIVICQKSDVVSLGSSNAATKGVMSMEELLTALFAMFRIAWDIDDDGNFRIEHISYWTRQQGIELSDLTRVNEYLLYEHGATDVPRIERLKFMEQSGEDFQGEDILYDSQCASEKVEEISPGKVTTDVGLILSDPEAVSKDGFVFLSASYGSGIYSTVTGTGVLSGDVIWNAPFAKANLQDAFWRHDRYLPSGNMNGEDVDFDGSKDSITQETTRASFCCVAKSIDAKKSIGTALGTALGVRATVVSITYDLSVDRVEFEFSYPY